MAASRRTGRCTSRSARTARGGFTLAEVIGALVLLSIALPPMLVAVYDAQLRRLGPSMSSTARWLAEERLEQVIADRHSSTRGYSYIVASNYPTEFPVPGMPDFARFTSIQEVTPDLTTPGTGYKTVRVTINWNDGVNGIKWVEISTVVTDY